MHDDTLLECRNLTRCFGALTAVNNLSFQVAQGEILGIGGPNGAGKTTLFDMLSGLTPPSSGQILFQGRDITRLSPSAVCHAGIARTFQLNAAFDSLSLRDNVRAAAQFGRRVRWLPGLRFDAETEIVTDQALALVGLAGPGDQLAGHLSVFQRKLLMMAGALATAPRLLLMDEPVGGLTQDEIERMMQVVRRIAETGVTVVMIEHVMSFLVTLSDRILILHHGEAIFQGQAADLVHDRTVVDVYLGEGASRHVAELAKGRPHAPA